MGEERPYEVKALDDKGVVLSLHRDRHARDHWGADTFWEAIGLLARVPARAWRHWEDIGDAPDQMDSELVVVATVQLWHVERRTSARGSASYGVNLLEDIDRSCPPE